jgi:hypothetical protein
MCYERRIDLCTLPGSIIQQEVLYAMGMTPGLSSDTTIDESSELSEVSVQGPAELLADSESVGDSEEWEDVL